MPPFATDVLLPNLRALYRSSHVPVRAVVLAETCDCKKRTTQKYLAALEAAGLVERRTMKTGWLPVRTP